MNTSSSVDLIDKDGKVICSETIQRAGCLPVLRQLVEEVAPKLMRRSRCRIVAASIDLPNNSSNTSIEIGRYLRNDLHTNLGINTFRVCALNGDSLDDIAKATWGLV